MENKFSSLLGVSTDYYGGLLNTDKERAIVTANEEKIRSLQEYQNQRAAAKAKYDATLIGKLGLDPDGIAGFGVNLAANAGAGALSTISGQVGTGIHTLWGGANLAGIPDEALAARKHMLDGTATDAEKELLDSPVGKTQQKSSANRWQNDIEAAKATNLDRIRAVERSQRNAQGIREALDLSKYVYQNDKESLVSDLKKGAAGDLAKVSKGWDQLKDNEEMAGWGNIASGVAGSTAEIAKAALKNPKGALEYVAENAPQAIGAFIGKGVGVATNLLYGLDTYDKGLQAYSKDNGQIAPSDERTRMQLLSAAAVAAETLGDKAVVGASKIGSDLASGIGAAAGNVSRKGFKDTLLNTAKAIDNTVISRTGKATLAGAAGEYPTEGVQTWLENEVQGKESTLEDVYVGAALGAITGGTTSGGVSGVGEAGRLASTSLSKVQKIFQAAEATKAAVDTAAKTGDVSVFTAPESPAYSPTKALSALHEFNQLDTTDNDTRDANVVKGMEILGTMEDGLRALKAQTPQGKQEIKQDLDKLKAKMAATDPADTQALDGLKQKATKLEELMATPLAKDTEVKQLNQKIQSQVKEIEAANDLHGKMADFALEKLIESLDLDAELATADAPVDVNDSTAVAKSDAAAQNIITLSMVHRDRVTPEQAKQLADNTSNGLSESARSYFRAFSEAKVAELEIKDMGKVSQDVFYGDVAKNQMGIPQYRTRVNSALASGNQRVANRTLDMLDNFVTSHTSKLSFAQEALKKANETGMPVSVARTKQGTWEFLPQPFQTEKARRNNGGVTIDPGNTSLGLISSIEKEAKALQAAQGELQAAYTLKFNPTAVKSASQPVAAAVPTPARVTAAEAAIQPIAPTVEETTNVDQAPEAVQATQKGQQEETQGSAVTRNDQAINQPESSSGVTTEGNVAQAVTSEGNVENRDKNEQVSDVTQAVNKHQETSLRNAIQYIQNVTELVQIAQENGPDRLKPVFQMLSERLDLSAINLKYSYNQDLGRVTGATWDDSTKTLTIYPDEVINGHYGMSGEEFIAEVIAHELVHAATVQFISNGVLLSIAPYDRRTADEKLADVYDRAKDYIRKNMASFSEDESRVAKAMIKNTKELVAWGMTDPIAQQLLSKIPGREKKNLFLEFVSFVASVIGVSAENTALSDLLTVGAEMISQNLSAGVREGTSSDVHRVSDGGRDSGRTEESTQADGSTEEAARLQSGGQPGTAGEVSPEPVDSTPVEPGKLQAFSVEVPEGTTFKDRNLVASDLKQSAGGELSTTRRPLAATKNLLSKWYESSGEVLNDFLENGLDSLNEHQKDLLNLFRDKARDWAPAFQASVGKKDESKRAFYFQDLMQFLLESKIVDGKEVHELEENVKTAMGFAVFSYIGEQAAKPAFNDDEAINKLLHRDKEHPVSKDEYELLFDKGTREANVINLLGQRAVAALGITAKKSANKDTLSRLQVAMGVHAMRVMVDQGILERGTVNGLAFSLADGSVKDYSHLPVQYRDQIAEMVNKPELLADFKIADVDTSGLDKDTRAKVLQAFRSLKSLYEVKHNFLKIKRNADLKLLPQTEVIYRASVGSQGILGKLFSVETGLKEPSLTPISYNQMNTKGTKRWVPERLAAILNKMSQEANYIKEDHWVLWNMLGPDALLEMAGKKSTSKATTHISERKGIEAKNDALTREIENFDLFLQNIIQPRLDENEGMRINEVDIYFEYEAWKQQRVGLATNLINPQTSKIQRFMLARKSWKTQVDPENQDQLNNFMLRVAEGFGIKTDRMDMESALAEVEKKLKDPKIEAAVQAIIDTAIKQGDMTDDLNKAIVAGVKTGGEKFHSMDALIALARYKHADGKPFPTELMGEIDGVTNGPMLTHLLLGAANSVKDLFARINRGGFFQEESKHSQYNVWRGQPGQKDLYESLTRDIQAEAQKLMDANPSLSYLWDAVYKFTGDLGDGVDRSTPDGRNFVKTPLTALIFGSSPYRSKLRTADKFVTGIYSKLAKLDEAKDAERFLTIKAINNLIGNKTPRLPMNLTVAQLRETEFSKEQLKAITGAFNYTLGSAVQEVMKTSFKPLIDRRDSFNQSAELAYTLYSSVYQAKRKEFLKKLMAESGDVTKSKDPTKDGEALHDLTEEQEAELRRSLVNMFPALQTLMSLDSKQTSAGIQMVKSTRKISQQKAYENEIVFGTPFQAPNQAKSQKTMVASGYEEALESPGVGMLPFAVHSLDSAISHYAALLSEVLNVHDAHGTGLGNFQNAARNLNHATWNALLNYSPTEQMYLALEKTVTGFAEVLSRPDTSPEVVAEAKAAIKGMMDGVEYPGDIGMFLTDTLIQAKWSAYEADKIRLGALAQMTYIDQYALEGGNYAVTDKDRAEAQKKLDEMLASGGAISEATWEKLNAISLAVTGIPAPKLAPTTSAWGAIGKSGIPSDAGLIKEFKARDGKMTVKEATTFMNQRLLNGGEATGFNKFKRQLMWRLMKSLDPNTVIKYVTPSTPESEVMSRPSNPESRAWVSVDGKTGKAEIYVLSAEHEFSGFTEESLLHEMVHAAVTLAIAAGQKPGAKGAAADLVQSLEALRKGAELYINSNPDLQAEFGHMVANVDELVAWGMTNQDFQNKVLKNIKSQSKMGSIAQKLRDGLTVLIGIFTNYLFGDATPEKNNGMVVLINDVSALFKAADELKDSQSETMTLSQAYAAPINKVNSYSTADLYAALDKGKISPAFNEQLKDLLNGIVEKLHGPFGSFKASLMQNQTLTPMDVWLKALDTGKAPFASSALTAGFKISDQEAFVLEQVEATVKAAMTDNAGQTTAVYSELRRLYAEAERRLKPTDFADPALYDFLFKVEAGKGNQSDYLSRFAALGLTHEGVSTLLQFNTERDTRSLVDAKTLLDKLRYLFDKALTLLNGKLTHTTEGMRADDKLKTLVEQLVDIEAKKRRQLLKQDPGFLAPVANMADSATNAVRKKIVDLANSGPVQNSKNGLVKFAGTAVSITASNQVGAVMAGIQKMRDQFFKEKNGLLMGMANELRGPKSWLEKLLRMRKKQEQDRKHVITETAKSINESFGRKLNSEEKSAVTAMFLRTGMHSLLGKYDMSQIHELVEDRNALNAAIKDREAQLNEFPDYQHYFTFQAKALAHHRTNGEVKSALLMMNAGNIAKLYGTAHVGKMSVAQTTRAEVIIDQLTTLYAMKYVDPKHIGPAKAVMRDEMLRNATMNGVEMVLTLHKALENESKATLFEGSEALMMKGHTPEIYNPHTDVRIATTPEEMREAKLEGYVSYGELQQDATDTVLPGGVIMVLKDGGLQPWQSGAVSFRGRQAKGSKLHSGYNNPFHESGVQNTALSSNMARAKQSAIASMFQPNPGFNPSAEKRNFMAPIMSANGTVSNWRYLMNDQLKDNALERDSSVDQVLGMLAGSMFDKQTANTVNVQVIHALKEHFNAEYKYSPSSFVKIAHDSPDAEMRDVYAMLPKETRDEISKVWGREGLRVPYEMLDIVFGYRKASLSTVWEKEKTNLMETALIMAVESSLYQYARIRLGMSADDAEDYSKRGAVTMRRAENIWQEVVRETKDTIVVKTGTVMLDNIVSNISLLRIHGVGPSDLIKHHRVAFKAARAYQQDKSKVFQLEQKLSLGMLTPEEARKASRELVMLEDAIARNPVLPLIDAGLMPTIVEDVSQDDDPYTYKSQLTRKLKEYGEKVNPMVMTAAKNIYMTHDTAPYKFLSQATQLSDFVARYTLYQHLTTKKDKPLSHEAAIQAASDSFINYDVPMHKTMQYLDDAGIVPFMKYALRIQRVLYRLAKEKPAAVMSMVLLGNMFESLPLVTDSGMVNRLGNNPFQWGAFKYPTTLDQLATVNGALSLVK